MVLDYDQINQVIQNIADKFNLNTSEESIDKLIQKVENNNYYCTVECKELHILTPTVKNGFFFKNTDIVFNNKFLVFGKFDPSMIIKAKVVKDRFQFTDINGNKFECHKSEVNIKIKELPLDLFMTLLS
jgi:hypothetical protein